MVDLIKDYSTEIEHIFESKRILLKRRHLRNIQSVSDGQNQSLKSSFNRNPNNISLKKQNSDLKENILKFTKIIKICEKTLISLSNDLLEIINNANLSKTNIQMIIEGLLHNHLTDQLNHTKNEIDTFSQSPILNKLSSVQDQEIIQNQDDNLITERKSNSQTPETVVKKSFRSLKKIIPSSKTSLKISIEKNFLPEQIKKHFSFKNCIKNQNKSGKELKQILEESKKEYKSFLRSLGWTEDRIEEIIKQENYLMNPQSNQIIHNSADPSSNSALTKTLNVVIKEYAPSNINEDTNDNQNPSNIGFCSKKTNNLKEFCQTNKQKYLITKSNSICNYSKLDIDKMSLSNNLSDLQVKKEENEEINIYSHINSINEISPLPISDPKLSKKKIMKNKKIKDFLDKEIQNISNKSFLSLKDNREIFSRKNSSLQDSAKINCKNVKIRLIKKKTNPRSFQFKDILEDNLLHDVAILEYQNDSQLKGISFQSMRHNDTICLPPALPPSKAVSILTGKSDYSFHKSKNKNSKQKLFNEYDKICNEIFTELFEQQINSIKKDKIKKSKTKKSDNNIKKQIISDQIFENKMKEFLRNVEFPYKTSYDQVGDFLTGYSDFLCANKLYIIVENINKCKFLCYNVIDRLWTFIGYYFDAI